MESAVDYKDILVFLDTSPDAEARLNLAASLAQAHDARLLGVDVSSSSAAERRADQAADLPDLQALFEGVLESLGVDGQYLVADRGAAGAAIFYAHCADLVVATQHGEDGRAAEAAVTPEQVLLSAGVPVLVLPRDWRPVAVGERVVFAWNASREATRAAHDALPILARARKVTVFTFGAQLAEAKAGAQLMADHLRRHGVPAEVSTWTDAGGMSPMAALFADLDTQEADLIVSGAYGHSSLAERLFGGASHDLLQQPTLPLLMSH